MNEKTSTITSSILAGIVFAFGIMLVVFPIIFSLHEYRIYNLFNNCLFLLIGILCMFLSVLMTFDPCSLCSNKRGIGSNIIENQQAILNRNIRMGIDYDRNSFDRDFQIHPELQVAEYNRRHDELINRLRELQFQQAALRPPRPIILTTQQNRQPDYRPPDYSNPDCVILNDHAIARVILSTEEPKPIIPKKISNAISTLELTD